MFPSFALETFCNYAPNAFCPVGGQEERVETESDLILRLW